MKTFNEFLKESEQNIVVDTSYYVDNHKKKPKPDAFGSWMFSTQKKFDHDKHKKEDLFQVSASYKEAAKKAIDYFEKNKHVGSIWLQA